MSRTAPLVALAGLLLATIAQAAPPSGAVTVSATRACPALFGSASTRARNAALRRHQLDWIDEDASGVTIAHSNERWRHDPYALRIRGLQLVGIEARSAVFELSQVLAARLGCKAGRYQLQSDDPMLGHTRVLAVLSRGVLVEHRGRLAFIAKQAAPIPRWLVGWRMQAELRSDYSSSAAVMSGPLY